MNGTQNKYDSDEPVLQSTPIKKVMRPDRLVDRLTLEHLKYQVGTLTLINPKYDLADSKETWTLISKSRFIESMLLNIPTPPIYLHEYNVGKYAIVNGRQRFQALIDFLKGEFELAGLEYHSELIGETYDSLPEVTRRQLNRTFVPAVIVLDTIRTDKGESPLPDGLKSLILERIKSL